MPPRHDRNTNPVADLATQVHELTEPYIHLERYYDRTGRRWRIQPSRQPSLLDQLRAATVPAGTADMSMGEFKQTWFSTASANLDAVHRLQVIRATASEWLEEMGVARRASLEADIHGLVGGAPKLSDARRDRLYKDVARWWTWSRIFGGWQDPPWRPQAPCPACDAMVGERRGIRVRLDLESAVCLACGETWSPETIGLLAEHIRHYTGQAGRPQQAADAPRSSGGRA